MTSHVRWFALAVLLLAAPRAFGLATEHFGNAPVPAGFGFPAALLPLLNADSRVYWYEVNGDATFFYRGGSTPAANDALRKFAAGGKGLDVYLLPGPREVHSLTRTHHFVCDWELRVPGGIPAAVGAREKDTRVFDVKPTLFLYVSHARPAAPADARQLGQWIAELDSDDFKTRDQAVRELEKQGPAVEAALRKALAARPSPEARKRLTTLLGRLAGINLAVLEVPTGLKVQGLDELLERYRQGLKSTDPTIRGLAASRLAARETDPEAAVTALVEVLKKEKNEYPRRCIASSLQNLGKSAAAALPVLEEGLSDPDKNVQAAYKSAVEAIKAAPEEKDKAEKVKKAAAIRADVGRFLKALPAKAKE
jgi:hypothetical protein